MFYYYCYYFGKKKIRPEEIKRPWKSGMGMSLMWSPSFAKYRKDEISDWVEF